MNTLEMVDAVLPHLVHCAQQRRLITYGDLAENAGLAHHRPMRLALGFIRDDLCVPLGLPFLTAIVITKDTKQPGDSFLPDGTAHLTPEERRQAFESLRDESFACDRWHELLAARDLKPVAKSYEDLLTEAREYSRMLARKGGVGEGEAHKALKLYVSKNPTVLGLTEVAESKVEHLFPSGDECDVAFRLTNGSYAVVEVKNGDHGELVKGVFQAIKYRSLMVAEKGEGEPFPVDAYLVAYKLDQDIIDLAAKFGIQCVAVPVAYVNAIETR